MVASLVGWLELNWAQSRVIPGLFTQRVPWQHSEAEVGMSWEILGCFMCWAFLAGKLESKWCGPEGFQGVSYLPHLDQMSGVVVSADKRCSDVCCAGATMVGWLELEWVRAWGSLR